MPSAPKNPRMSLFEKLYVAVICLAAPILLIGAVIQENWLLAVVAVAAVVLLLMWWRSRNRTAAAVEAVTEEEIAAIINRSTDHNSAVAVLRAAHPGIGVTDAHLIIQSRAGARFAQPKREQGNETGS